MVDTDDRRRGPKPKFTLEDAVDIALDLGLAEFSLAAVAKELGFSTPSLYRVIENRDDLVDKCLERISRTLQLPPADQPWQDQLRMFTDEMWRVLDEYPGLGEVVLTRPLSTLHAKDYIWQLVDQCQEAGYGDDRMGFSFGLMMLSDMIFINHIEVEQRRKQHKNHPRLSEEMVKPKGRISLSQRLFFKTDEIWLDRGNLRDKVNFIITGMEAQRQQNCANQTANDDN
ncbi:TetR/AcrR family transcriptional regulator [Corynebacterium mendelii]|uniref:TetR/AcrR family transcriptional regulator n=1 Tax=Corynebacterium mendelii TaxID=2765362 RepID=A0A939DYY9_9CORY|nr:TetR/AcrR family transcriptional regulator [Corynebacterium mendelii]MBN9643410.1 TetR/AcrR family transcriptional regulator [Corynebacterium mendelii]